MPYRPFLKALYTAGSAFAVLAALTLSACAPSVPMSDEDLVRAHQFRPPYRVDRTVHEHLVSFNPTKPEFSERERRNLYGFFVGVGASPGDRVVLASRNNRLEQRGELVHFLRQMGLRPEVQLIKEDPNTAQTNSYDTVIIVRYVRYIVRRPDCANWTKDNYTNFYNTPQKNFGCATTAALGQQIAYPSSLIQGVTLSYPEGDVAAESVSRYRGRTVEETAAPAAGN